MGSCEHTLFVPATINPPRRMPKVAVAASGRDGSAISLPPVPPIESFPCCTEAGAAVPAEDWREFEHILDEKLSCLRAQLVMAHRSALQSSLVPSFVECLPVRALTDDVPHIKSSLANGHSGPEHIGKEQLWPDHDPALKASAPCGLSRPGRVGQEHVHKLPDHGSEVALSTSNGHSVPEQRVGKDGEISLHHVKIWASLCEQLLESAAVLTPRIAEAVEEPAPDWVLHRVWLTQVDARAPHPNRHAVNRISSIVDLEALVANDKTGESREGDRFVDKLVLHPDGIFRYFWAILGTIILIYDGVTIPLELVELLDGAPRSLARCAFAYWVVDFPVQMSTGFHANGVVELRFSETCRRYLRTWCVVDVSILIIDFFFLIVKDIEYLNAGKGMRIVRNMRVLRLARVGRLRRIGELINQLSTRIFSEYVAMLVKISQLIILLVAVNHYIACMWYGLGKTGEDETWLTELSLEHKPYLYVMSLHWSLTQFGPATNNVAPKNFVERLFAVGVVMFALVYFSSFISSVTNQVSQLKMYGQEKQKERSRIREFIVRKSISIELGARIQVFFDEHYSKTSRPLQEEDICFFKDLPETLRIRMHEEVFLPLLLEHQPFRAFSKADLSLLTMICHVAMAERHFIPEEDVFVKHMLAQKVRVVVKGNLDYIMSVATAKMVTTDTWASEQALYVNWKHSGKFTALTSCEMAEIDCEQFHMLILQHTRSAFRCFQVYANIFFTLMEAAVEEGSLITDVDIGGKDFNFFAERCVAFYHKVDPSLFSLGEALQRRWGTWAGRMTSVMLA